ncbi:MAG: hypothetical protein ACOC7U_07985, partial [Spirochaetota bacterium]
TVGWLDGTSEGEKNPGKYLDFLADKGAACLCIMPDRNWNITDPEERELKVNKLYELVEHAKKIKMPVIAGTEMNKWGQKFVDDFFADAMKPVNPEFMEGSRILTGHTLVKKQLGWGISSEEAVEKFGDDLHRRNCFFEQAGHLQPAAQPSQVEHLKQKLEKMCHQA